MFVPEKFSGLDLTGVKPILNHNLIVANRYNYRIYSITDLKYILDGIVLDKKIRAMYCQNEFMYVGCSNKLYTIKRNVIDIDEYEDKIESILVFHPIKIIATKHKLYINENKMSFQGIKGIIHVPTYLNKILLYTPQYIKIINIVSLSVVVTIMQSQITQIQDQTIQLIKETQALDIVAVGMQNPSEVVFLNLQTFEIIAKYDMGQSIIKDIQFNKSGNIPYMAVVQDKSLTLFNLNTQELIYKYTHAYQIDWTLFLSDNNIVIGSKEGNSIQQFSLEEHKIMSIIRERLGVRKNIEKCRFYGQQGEPQINYIAISKEEILYQSIVNQNLTQIKKGSINNFSFSTLRENDWANILTNDNQYHVEFWNIYQKKLTTKINGLEKQERVLQTLVSKCGNYGFCANLNQIHKFTMQSGLYQKTYKLQNNFLQMYIDPANISLVVAEQGLVEKLDFVSGQCVNVLQTESNVNLITGSLSAQLIALSLQTNQILIVDYQTMKVIRTFDGHNEKILDMVLTVDNQHLVSSSIDKKIKIWNLVYGNLVQQITVNKALISIDISENQLIGVFLNSRQVNVWTSSISNSQILAKAKQRVETAFHSDLSIKSTDFRAQIYGKNKSKQLHKIEEEKDNQQLVVPEQKDDDLITFTKLEEGRWVPIQHIDLIRERNRVTLAEADIKLPFFMDFRNADIEKQNILNDLKDQAKEKTKILKSKKDKYLAELKSDFEILVDAEDFKLIDLIKKLSPTSYDYELRSILMGKPQNQIKIFRIFEEALQSPSDLDLKVTYLLRYIEVVREDIDLQMDEELKPIMQKIAQILEQQWEKLDDQRAYIECVIEFSKTVV